MYNYIVYDEIGDMIDVISFDSEELVLEYRKLNPLHVLEEPSDDFDESQYLYDDVDDNEFSLEDDQIDLQDIDLCDPL